LANQAQHRAAHTPEQGPVRLTIVGAGAHFTPGLLAHAARRPDLAGTQVALYDPDPERLQVTARWAQRLIRDMDAALTVEAVDGLAEAVRGANVVFTTVRHGGGRAARFDLEVPARHGVEQGVGDTVGPGGFAYALRQIPAFLHIVRTIEQESPGALIVNFSNPMTVIGRAIARVSEMPCIGLCDGIYGRQRWIAQFLDVPVDELEVRHAGLNHLTWVTALERNGENLYPQLWQRAQEQGDGGEPISFQLARTFGLFPSPGDRHVAEFYPYFHRQSADGGRAYGLQTAADRIASLTTRAQAYWDAFSAEANGSVPIQERSPRESEDALAIVAYLTGATDEQPRATVNVPNTHGLVPSLPAGAVVEAMASPGKDGAWRAVPGPEVLPAGIATGLRARADQQELTVEAALTGDRQTALQALAADPRIESLEQATAILEDLLREQREWLPQFN
jgi:alpha-galactosidase/6-phospho-beta-glucosidase family protein